MSETVIVIRSLIPGGVAHADRRILPGDRLVYVNDARLDNAHLDTAVQALKGAAHGPVRLGIARPLEEVQRTARKTGDLTALAIGRGKEVSTSSLKLFISSCHE